MFSSDSIPPADKPSSTNRRKISRRRRLIRPVRLRQNNRLGRIEIGGVWRKNFQEMKVGLITGCVDPHYQVDLVSGLVEQDLIIEVIGNDAMEAAPIMRHPRVRFKNLRGSQDPRSSVGQKLMQVARYYLRLIGYATRSDASLFHLQWPLKLVFLERTIFNLYYRALGKKLVFTAHNVDQSARDGTPSWSSHLSLRCQYRMVDHVIVHTNKMKTELMNGFGVCESKISVVPHGVNSAIPESSLDRVAARKALNLRPDQRVLLVFGNIAPYKGIDLLVTALASLRKEGKRFTLMIAGRIKECQEHWDEICRLIDREGLMDDMILELKRIPDDCVELYFKAADVLALPYRYIFQSGVLFVAYRFGLPVIATDVGSLREDVIEGKTGFVCRAEDTADLARTIEAYFESDLFKGLEDRRREIRDYAYERYSWSKIGQLTWNVYTKAMGN